MAPKYLIEIFTNINQIHDHDTRQSQWLASILIINTLTMLTSGHADRGRPTLKR